MTQRGDDRPPPFSLDWALNPDNLRFVSPEENARRGRDQPES